MLKRLTTLASRFAKKWLVNERTVDNDSYEKYGTPPFAYADLNKLFTNLTGKTRGFGRPDYAWGALQGINLAKVLSVPRVSFIEFGVAGGNGLVALQAIAQHLQLIFGIEVEIYGFDAVVGMPKAKDHRDLPNLWREGHYPMDEEKLQQRLQQAQLRLGPVEQTIPPFLIAQPAPIAFIAFDLCFYSSTMTALQVLAADHSLLLPRVHCCFMNILARTFGDHNGERLAIADFNTSHVMRKLSKIYGLQYFLGSYAARQRWVEQYYMAHIFDHKMYGYYDGLIKETTRDLRDEET